MFQASLDQALREERHRADKWKQETEDIDMCHLLCSCAEPFRNKLIDDLRIAALPSFENFMLYFFLERLGESQREIALINERAESQKQHRSVILLEHLAKAEYIFKVKHIIDGLEYAHLFRVIAGFNHQSVKDLKEHASSPRHTACCTAQSKSSISIGKFKHFNPRGSSVSSYLSGPLTNKAYRGIVLLTFMNDGRKHALEVKNILERASQERRHPYIVYTISDFGQYVIENFMKHIIWIVSQVDFVVPILTEEYFQMLDKERDTNGSGLDEKYAPYVIEVLLAEWASNFKNRRLRCFKPQGVKWPPKPLYTPFLTCVDKPSALPDILIKSKRA